jgi:hypothetical protein
MTDAPKKPYAATCMVTKPGLAGWRTVLVSARSEEEAEGVAMRSVGEKNPGMNVSAPGVLEITTERLAEIGVTLGAATPPAPVEAQQIENARLLDENEVLRAALTGHDEAVQNWGRMIDERDAEIARLRGALKRKRPPG